MQPQAPPESPETEEAGKPPGLPGLFELLDAQDYFAGSDMALAFVGRSGLFISSGVFTGLRPGKRRARARSYGVSGQEKTGARAAGGAQT